MKEPIINKIKVDKIYSDEVGMYVTDFHYHFEKELELAIDHSTGEYADCYCKVTIQYKEPYSQEKLKEWHESRAPLYDNEVVKNMTGEELKHIIPISREEYDASVNQ